MRSCRSAYSSSISLRASPVSAREPEVEDRLRLDLGERELLHQARCAPSSASAAARISAITASRLSSAIR